MSAFALHLSQFSVNGKRVTLECQEFVHFVVEVYWALWFRSVFPVHVVAQVLDQFAMLFELF